MSINPNISQLDYTQAIKRTIDAVNDATRVTIAAANDFEIELDANDGDSVLSLNDQNTATTTVTSVQTDELLSVASARYSKAQLYVRTDTTISSPQSIVIQQSPLSTGNVWVNTAVTVTPTTAAGQLAVSGVLDFCALRVRAFATVAQGTGSATIFLVLKA